MRHALSTATRSLAMLTLTSLAACGTTAPDPSGPVSIAIAQALTGQTSSAGTFIVTGARADSGSTTEEITFGGPLTASPVPLTFVRRLTGAAGTLTITGSASLAFTSPSAATLTGNWIVQSGTGVYINTTGSGAITGTADFGATPPTGTLVYTGRLDR